MNCVVRISLILCLIRHSFTYSYEDIVNLRRTLFENYTNDVRPVLNQSEPIHVSIDMWISSIQSFDEKHGILRTSLGFGIMWNDEILRWNASETGHDYLNFPKQDVWYPKMHLRNSATENMFLRFTDDEDQLTVHFANGQAYLLESGLTTTNCDADIFRFPFDQHSCTLELVSILSENYLVMDIGYLQFVFPSDTNKQWKIAHISKRRSKHTFSSEFINSEAVFTIHFKRKPTFLVLNILIPVVGLGLVNPLVFAQPESSGERVSLSVTLLLALVFFLNLVSERLPPINDPISMLNISIITQVIISIFILVFAILTMIINEKALTHSEVPKTVRLLAESWISLTKRNRSKNTGNAIRIKPFNAENVNNGTNMPKNDSEEDDKLSIEGIAEKERIMVTWHTIGNLTSRMCLKLFSFLIVLNWALYLVFVFVL